jgi:predicted nucleic-acid-binding Zn-ribbon protein
MLGEKGNTKNERKEKERKKEYIKKHCSGCGERELYTADGNRKSLVTL